MKSIYCGFFGFLIFLSTNVQAQNQCQVDLIKQNGRRVDSFYDFSCQRAMRQCERALELRENYRARCVIANNHGPGYPPPPPYQPPYQEQVTCQTNSNGFLFREEGIDEYRVRERVVRECQRNRRTDYYECERRVRCDRNGYYPPQPPPSQRVICRTHSNRYFFEVISWDSHSGRQAVINDCRRNYATHPRECELNAYCQPYR